MLYRPHQKSASRGRGQAPLAGIAAARRAFNNWAVFYQGRFVTVNQLDGAVLEKLLRA